MILYLLNLWGVCDRMYDRLYVYYNDTRITVCIERPLGNITIQVDLEIHIALTNNSSRPLLKIGRSPRHVEIVKCHKPLLHVGSRPHLEGRAQKDTYLSATHFGE